MRRRTSSDADEAWHAAPHSALALAWLLLLMRGKKTSQYKGVCFHKKRQAWHPFLYVDGEKQRRLRAFGYYDTEKQAAKAHDWCVSDTPCALPR